MQVVYSKSVSLAERTLRKTILGNRLKKGDAQRATPVVGNSVLRAAQGTLT